MRVWVNFTWIGLDVNGFVGFNKFDVFKRDVANTRIERKRE